MSEQPLSDAERTVLERELLAIGSAAFPRTRSLAPAVIARLRERRSARPWWVSLAPAAVALVAIVVGVILLVPGAASTARELLRLPGIAVFRGPDATAPAPAQSPAGLSEGTRVATIAEAEARAGFRPLVPSDARLRGPDEITVRTLPGATEIDLAYGPRAGIPVSSFAGVSVLVTEVQGTLEPALLGKVLPPGARLEEVSVAGGRGIWIEGAPHLFFYRSRSGTPVEGTLRLAGNVLLWEQAGLLLRIEAQLQRDEVLRIAATVR
jgi:hypothetical protein